MPDIWLAWLAILCGFAGLIWSADRFVDGSAAIASNFGLSKLIIGLTIVSLGTSAPEIVVSISAALKDAGDMAIGNALGSNLANVGLVLAITALIAPMPIKKHLLTQEVPILLLVTALAGVILWDTTVTLTEGIILLGSIGPLLYLMAKHKKEHPEEASDDEIPELGLKAASVWFVIGLGTLIASSEILVWGATQVATDFGVSPLIIGLTVVAVGTSLPELAASVMSAIRGHHEMALGNIIGSNIFNILTVMAVPGLISPPVMEDAVFSRDYLAMAGMTLLLACAIGADYILRNRGSKGTGHARLGRRIGTTLLLAYIAYYVVLFS